MSNRKLRNDLEELKKELKKEVEKLRKELADKQATPAPVIHVWPTPVPYVPPQPLPLPGTGVPWTLPDTIICHAAGVVARY